MPQPVIIDKPSVVLGATCALCKQPFAPNDEIIVCPQDGTQHHTYCWEANGNRCTALGCAGRGPIERVPVADPAPPPSPPNIIPARRAGRRTPPAPARQTPQPATDAIPVAAPRLQAPAPPAWTQTCVILAVALAILVFGFSCFGLWAIADYIMLHVLHWDYRLPAQNGLFDALPLWFAAARWLILA